jgi:hypothetical protein
VYLANLSVYAQKPDIELTKDEAIIRIQELQSNIKDLEGRLQGIETDVERLKKELETTNAKLKACNESFYKNLGVTDADIAKFRQQIGVVEGKIRDMQRLPDDDLADRQDEVKALENELNQLRGVKMAVIPEFYNKIIQLAQQIKGLYREKKIKKYTVGTWAENRDCLWNISAKAEIYSDPFQWPKIWQGNTEQIKNPDIIHPGQVLTIPPPGPKTSEEMKAERKYWRKKHAMMEQQSQEGAVKKGE